MNHRSSGCLDTERTPMNVELNLEELELIVEALDKKHDVPSSGDTEVLPELQAVSRLYNRLMER